MKKAALLLWVVSSLIIGLAVSSNMFGAVLLHHAYVLGPAHFLGSLYGPWMFPWWYATIRVPGTLYSQAGSVGLIVFVGLAAVGYRRFAKMKVNVKGIYGTARWMSLRELAHMGSLYRGGGMILGQTAEARMRPTRRNPLTWTAEWREDVEELGQDRQKEPNDVTKAIDASPGGLITRSAWSTLRTAHKGEVIFSNKETNALVVGPPGSGKNVSVFVPSLISWTGSCVVNDVKDENFEITSGWRREFSYVYRFAPADPNSAHINPLFEIEPGLGAVAAAQNIAEMLANPHGDADYSARDDAHWMLEGKHLLVAGMLFVLESSQWPEKSPYSVYRLFNDPKQGIRNVLNHMLDTSTNATVQETARNMQNKADNELSGVVSTASSYLQLFQDPIVAANTAESDFRLADLARRDAPCTLYISVSPADAQRMQPLVRMLFQLVGGKLMTKLGANRHPVLLAMDEFPSLGRMDFFERQLAQFRGYGVRVLLGAQSFTQLFDIYGTNTSIIDNCAEIAVLGAGHRDAKALSSWLGTRAINRESRSKSSSIGSFFEWTQSTNVSEAGRPLMTEDELTTMPYEDFLLLSQGHSPYKGKKILYPGDDRFLPHVNLPTFKTREDQEAELGAPPVIGWKLATPTVRDQLVLPQEQPDEPEQSIERAVGTWPTGWFGQGVFTENGYGHESTMSKQNESVTTPRKAPKREQQATEQDNDEYAEKRSPISEEETDSKEEQPALHNGAEAADVSLINEELLD